MIFENNIICGGPYPKPECGSLGDLVVKNLKRRADEVILVIKIDFSFIKSIQKLRPFYLDQWGHR